MSQTAKKRPSRSVKAQGHWYWCHSTSAFLLVFCCNYVSTLHYLKILKDTVNHFHKFKEVHQTSIKPRQYLHIKFEMPLFSHSEGITVAVPEIRLGLPKFKRSRDHDHAPSERYASDMLWSTYVPNLKSLSPPITKV